MVEVPIDSKPSGATLRVNNSSYQTPVIVSLPRGEGDFTIEIEKPGYLTEAIVLKESIDGWVVANIFSPIGFLGFFIDAATRDGYDLSPESVLLNLSKDPEFSGHIKEDESALNSDIAINDLQPFIEDYRFQLSLELGVGQAKVNSKVSDAQNLSYVVANGESQYSSIKLSMDNRPISHGWKHGFRPQFFHQEISISDFRSAIPLVNAENSRDIPFVVTEFETGQEVDPLDPNIYDIEYNSIGLSLYGGTDFPTLIFKRHNIDISFDAAISLMDANRIDIVYGNSSKSLSDLVLLNSISFDFGAKLYLPKSTSVISLGIGGEYYPEIKAPQELEFRDSKVVFNEDKNIFERKRLFLNHIEMYAWELHMTYTRHF